MRRTVSTLALGFIAAVAVAAVATSCGSDSTAPTNKTYVAGLPDAQGSYTGWYDNATVQLYTAAADGVARKFYLYPDVGTSTQYFFGSAVFDMNITGAVDGAVQISGDFSASTIVAKVG